MEKSPEPPRISPVGLSQCTTVEAYVTLHQDCDSQPQLVVFAAATGVTGRSLKTKEVARKGQYLFGEFPLVVLEDADGGKLLNAIQFTLAMENTAEGGTLKAAQGVIFDMCDPNSTEDIFQADQLDGFDDVRPADHDCRFTCDRLNKLVRIYSANAHNISTAELDESAGAQGKNGIFPMTALMNHSCAPNCGFTCGDTFATSDIAKGAELTISYLSKEDLELPRKARQDILREGFHFDCVCSKCSSEAEKTITAGPPVKKLKAAES